jgi:hypothetical protein
MRRKRRRRYDYSRDEKALPKAEPLTGEIIGARRLGVRFLEEGIIALGHVAERWRLTDDIDALLAPDDEFVAGSSYREIRKALEARHPSPVPGVSRVEICNGSDMKLHVMPFADSVIVQVRRNPQHVQYRWGDSYIKTWIINAIETLTRLTAGGEDLLISHEAEEIIRTREDFEGSDLVIARRDNWYSIVKYRPSKAAARRHTRTTIKKKDEHANELVVAARELRGAAIEAYAALREELDRFGACAVLTEIKPQRHYHSDDDTNSLVGVRYIHALLPIHAALLGKHAYRYNLLWQGFLDKVRARLQDLDDVTWGNYGDVKPWLEAECRLRKLPPTAKMLAAKAAAEAEELRKLTCARCGDPVPNIHHLSWPPTGCRTRYPREARLCGACWQFEYETIGVAEPVAADG